MLRLLRRAGLPGPETQYVIRDAGRFVRRVDFAYPEHRLGIETFGNPCTRRVGIGNGTSNAATGCNASAAGAAVQLGRRAEPAS